MNSFATALVALLIALSPAFAAAQPIIDGSISGDEAAYEKLAEWTQTNTGFGDHGMLELYATVDGTNLYVNVVGEAESNSNAFLLFIDLSSQNGVPSGTALPSTTDGFSPLNNYAGSIHDFETDFGIRLTSSSDSGTDASFMSIADYRDLSSGADAPDQLLSGPRGNGSFASDGTAVTFSGGTAYDGTVAAYDHTGSLSSVTVEGWEFSVPLSALGWSAGDEFRLFALYGSGGGFISANTLPEIAGQSGVNLGNSPDFTGISGDQFTSSSTLPVELSRFRVSADGSAARLQWTTVSETNNAGFAVQHAVGTGSFQRVGWVDGAGTTAEAQQYAFDVDALDAGTHRFRLAQYDLDGTVTLTRAHTVTIRLTNVVFEPIAPNPVRGAASFSFGVGTSETVTADLYNTLGQHVRTLYRGTPDAGRTQTVQFDTGGLASGLYFVRLQGESFRETQSVSVVR